MRFLKHFRRYYKYSPSPSPFSEPFPVSNCFGYRFKWATLSCYFLVIYSRRNRVMFSAWHRASTRDWSFTVFGDFLLRYCGISRIFLWYCGVQNLPPQSPLWLGTNHESLFIVEGQGGGGFLDDNTIFRGNRREISCCLQNILGNYKGFMKGSIEYYRDLWGGRGEGKSGKLDLVHQYDNVTSRPDVLT